jgi:hypothetical protein
MNSPKGFAFSWTALLVLLLPAPAALAQTYDFTYTDAAGDLVATGNFVDTNGIATAGSVTITNPAGGTLLPITLNYLAPVPGTGPIGVEASGGAVFDVDNVVFPTANAVVDYVGGLGFTSSASDTPNYVVYLSAQNPDLSGGVYFFESGRNSDGSDYVYSGYNGGTLTTTAIPEPTAYAALLGAIVLGSVIVRRKPLAA